MSEGGEHGCAVREKWQENRTHLQLRSYRKAALPLPFSPRNLKPITSRLGKQRKHPLFIPSRFRRPVVCRWTCGRRILLPRIHTTVCVTPCGGEPAAHCVNTPVRRSRMRSETGCR